MEEPSAAGASRPRFRDGNPDLAPFREELGRHRDSELAVCCLLAVRAGQLRGGGSCRVVLAGDPPTGPGPSPVRVPVRDPETSGSSEAWLLLPAAGDETPPSRLEELRSLAEETAMVLERHRLIRAAGRLHLDLLEANASLAHDLRGHLHSALMRIESLELELGGDGADAGEVRNHLDGIRHLLWEMEEDISEGLELPESTGATAPRTGGGELQELPVPELLREARGEGGEDAPGEALPELEIGGDLPPVRSDRVRLLGGLRELLDLATRSRDASVITLSRASGPGVRVSLSVDLGPAPPAREGAEVRERAPERPEFLPPSLRRLVEDLGGRLWIEAEGGGRAEVVAILPAEKG